MGAMPSPYGEPTGGLVSNPYDAQVAYGGTHLIEASAERYSSWARWVDFDQDRSVDVLLLPRDP